MKGRKKVVKTGQKDNAQYSRICKSMLLLLCLIISVTGCFSVSASAANEARYYGKKLTGNARLMYDELLKFDLKSPDGLRQYSGENNMFEFKYVFLDKEAERKSYRDAVPSYVPDIDLSGVYDKTDWMKAMAAYLYDFKDAYWVFYFRYHPSFNVHNGKLVDPKMYIEVKPQYQFAMDKDNMAVVDAALQAAYAKVKKGKTRFEIVRNIHDYILDTAEPGFLYGATDPDVFYTIYALLLNKYAHTGVCEAYASLFHLLCSWCDIPVVYVTGKGITDVPGISGRHGWNYVQMEDGKWYLVDTIFDDCVANASDRYKFFLTGPDKQHIPATIAEGCFTGMSEQPKLDVPVLSGTAYKQAEILRKTVKRAGKSFTERSYKYTFNEDGETVACTGYKGTVPERLSIPASAAYKGEKLKVTAIKTSAFANSKKVKTVTIGSNVISIGDSAFKGCGALKTVTIGKNAAAIGKNAFSGCKSLTNVKISSSRITAIGANAFLKAGSKKYKNLKVTVPKAMYGKYKKLLQKAKLSKKAAIRKK